MTSVLTTTAVAAALFALPFAASATTVTATNGSSDGVATPGDRTDLDNAFDGDADTFFSLGEGGSLVLDVSPLRLSSPASVIEVTFGTPNAEFPESAKVLFDATLAGEIFNDGAFSAEDGFSFSSSVSGDGSSFTLGFSGGPFSSLTFLDTTLANFGGSYGGAGQPSFTDGFEIAEVNVNAVPLPPAIALFLAPLAMLGWAGRRRNAA